MGKATILGFSPNLAAMISSVSIPATSETVCFKIRARIALWDNTTLHWWSSCRLCGSSAILAAIDVCIVSLLSKITTCLSTPLCLSAFSSGI